jgi:hypothetical protein
MVLCHLRNLLSMKIFIFDESCTDWPIISVNDVSQFARSCFPCDRFRRGNNSAIWSLTMKASSCQNTSTWRNGACPTKKFSQECDWEFRCRSSCSLRYGGRPGFKWWICWHLNAISIATIS